MLAAPNRIARLNGLPDVSSTLNAGSQVLSRAPSRSLNAREGQRKVVVLTSYSSGATAGRNLSSCGYSYDFVAAALNPFLREWGDVVEVANPERDLDRVLAQLAQQGRQALHVCVRALQHMHLTRLAPNVAVPCVEFPDVPDHAFDGNPRNDWLRVANACAMSMVAGPFAARTLTQAGVKTPVTIVPIPNPPEYFEVPRWQPLRRTELEIPGYELPQQFATDDVRPCDNADLMTPGAFSPELPSWRQAAARWYRESLRARLPRRVDRSLTAAWQAWRVKPNRFKKSPRLSLSGIVYTSIFAPLDPRKNWGDLLSGFLLGLGDAEDVTLVLKLVTRDSHATAAVLEHYQSLDLRHRCKLIVIDSFLSHQQMLALAAATTYYVTTTRAEGICLPLMNYLAAGRPAVSPRHTAIGDYFDSSVGFVVDSHPEPTAWSHDESRRCRSSWQRLVWPSLVEQLQRSARLARSSPADYEVLADRAQAKMTQWTGLDHVRGRLFAALDQAIERHAVIR